MLTIDKFYNARIVLENILRKTDLVHTKKVNTTCEVYLKPECLQRTGSFKIRGAYYKISQLSDEEKAKGVGSLARQETMHREWLWVQLLWE